MRLLQRPPLTGAPNSSSRAPLPAGFGRGALGFWGLPQHVCGVHLGEAEAQGAQVAAAVAAQLGEVHLVGALVGDDHVEALVFAGEAPGFVAGVMQVNLAIPDSVAAGTWPLVVTVGGVPSQPGVMLIVK